MAKAKTDTVTLMARGDVGPVLKPVERLADLIAPVFQQANIRFAQWERTYSQRDWPPRHASIGNLNTLFADGSYIAGPRCCGVCS